MTLLVFFTVAAAVDAGPLLVTKNDALYSGGGEVNAYCTSWHIEQIQCSSEKLVIAFVSFHEGFNHIEPHWAVLPRSTVRFTLPNDDPKARMM